MTQQPEPTVNSQTDFCPSCSMEWAYIIDGKRYTHLVGRVENDRVVEWECPQCKMRWER